MVYYLIMSYIKQHGIDIVKKSKKKASATSSAPAQAATAKSAASSSTSRMVATLTPQTSTLSLSTVNQQLYESIKSLIDPKQDKTMLPILKQLVERRIQSPGANLLAAYPDSHKQTMLDVLVEFYEENPENGSLKQFLDQWVAIKQFIASLQFLLRERGGAGSLLQFVVNNKGVNPAAAKYDDTLTISLDFKTMQEAALVIAMIETVLQEQSGIPSRSDRQDLPVRFQAAANGISVWMYFRQSEYSRFMSSRRLSTDISDRTLARCFANPKKDNEDYWKETLELVPRRELPHQGSRFKGASSSMFTEASQQSSELASTADSALGVKGRVFIFTGSRLGFGNYINAWRTIQGLCERMPGLQIDWVVEHGNQALPKIELPESVRFFARDSFWKMVPLVRRLSEQAGAVISLPNDWLSCCYAELVGEAPPKSKVLIVVDEYNCSPADERQLVSGKLHFTSGINAQGKSLGLIKPMVLTGVPHALEEQRQRISQDPNAACIFAENPEAPCYFAYIAIVRPAKLCDLKGVDEESVLALFVEHAKRSAHPVIKVVMPLNPQLIEKAIAKYPTVFEGCAISCVDAKESALIQHGDSLSLEVYNFFPFENNTFRLLINYAASCNTPIVMTGDQSFIELFFSTQDGCSFIYQLLGHKQELLKAIKLIAVEHGLNQLQDVIRRTENGLHAEPEIVELANFLVREAEELKAEYRQLRDVVMAQPDLIESLSAVIIEAIAKPEKLIASEVTSRIKPSNGGDS